MIMMHYICQIKCLEAPDLHYPIFLQFHFALPPVLHIMWYKYMFHSKIFEYMDSKKLKKRKKLASKP